MTVIRWEGPDILTLDKPAGLPVFPPHDDAAGDCLLARYRAERDPDGPWPEGFDGGIAHRLDTPTSGQVVVARTPDVLASLRDAFAQHRFRKRYVFLTERLVPWDRHVLEARIAHDRRHKGRMVVERGASTPHRGRWFEARTELEALGAVEGESPPGALFAWRAVITTGVTHQIRVHAAFAGVALAGDRTYGGGVGDTAWPVPFLLHHVGMEGPHLEGAPACPLPLHWPASFRERSGYGHDP